MAARMTIVTVGKPASHVVQSVEHFRRLLKPHCVLDLRAARSSPRGSGETRAHSCEREAAALRKLCEPRAWLVGLSAEGTLMQSEQFARWVGERSAASLPLCILIGGAHGLAPSLKSECREMLSLSSLTMAHDIALIVLLEQLFRAYSILKGHPYHK